MENKITSQSIENELTTISEEEENYVRMSLLLFDTSPCAVRALFDREFDPKCLNTSFRNAFNKLNDLKQKRIINLKQWNLLFPRNGLPDSNTFDVTLMITLLTNLTPLIHYDQLPLITDTTPSADLGRIKYYRNRISHNKDGKIDNSFFSTAWNDIIEAVGRLGGHDMLVKCKKLRTKILEQSTIPWNIKEQIRQILEAWKMNKSNFVETRAAKHVLESVEKNSCVTITASSGVGKTATLQYVSLKMVDEGYDVVPITNAQDIVRFYNQNKKTLFVMDDFCGTYSINQSDVNNLESVKERIKQIIQNKLTKIIVACRLQIYQDSKFDSLSIFRTCVCNLLSKDLCLLQTEKQSIAELYMETKASNIIQYRDLYDCFPLLCKLYHDNPELNITDFFRNPFSVYESEVDNLHRRGNYGKYCALALCVMFNNWLDEEWMTDDIDKETRTIIKNTCEACRLDRGTSRLLLLDELKSLEYTFVKKEQGVYKAIHDKVFDFLSFFFGQRMIQCLINNANSWIISQRLLLHTQDDMDQFITVVPPKYHHKYMQRMIDDWRKQRVQHVFFNINMKLPECRERFLSYLNTLDISCQRQLALTCDFENKDTVLLHCCYLGDIPLIKWCFYHGVDVNQFNCKGVSPLIGSAFGSNTEVIKILLHNKADINLCGDSGVSPLITACIAGNIEIIKILLDNKADIEHCMQNGGFPLYVACEKNHLDVVKILLENKADINKCTSNGASPLFCACQKNHIDIVKLLLDNNADINKCLEDEINPLLIACQNNHIEVVKVLLENKADINKCTKDGVSPVFSACQNNHIDIVKFLIDTKADINRCTNQGVSPLFIACQNNHKEIVKILLDNKADINKCTNLGMSPLFIASLRNHEAIVHLLRNTETVIYDRKKFQSKKYIEEPLD